MPFNGGIADESFSTRWFIQQYFARSGKKAGGVKEIAAQVADDPAAKDLFLEFGENLGTFLHPWLKRFRAGVLVIGGNVASAYDLFGPALEKSLKKQEGALPVYVSALKENAALIGSARLFDPPFWSRVQPLLASM